MPALAELHHCTGCTTCSAACPKDCITMEPDTDGFLHSVVDEAMCIGCGLCEKICPVIHNSLPKHTPAVYAVKSADEASRLASTSGGVFPELAKDILANGGVVFGAAYDEHFRVVHICAENETDLARLRGAKYSQSNLDGIFREVKQRLEHGQQVLFSGTPCQVLGLKTYLQKDYENLLLVDLVCHSVPSPMAWEKYLEYISGDKTLTAVNLRCKDTGWSRYSYNNRFDFADGSCRKDLSSKSLYMKLFGGGYITNPACTNCPAKGYARVSDLTLGDFWGIWETDPEMDDDKGTSAVLCQTERGRELLQRISDKLIMKEVSLEDVSRQNPALLRVSSPNERRSEALELIRNGKISACEAWFIPQKPSFYKRMRQLAGRIIRKIYKCCFQSNGRK